MGQHAALYASRRWKQRRAAQLAEHPLCRICLDVFGDVALATVADHVVPHRGDLELFHHGALQSLCASCHSSIKQQQETTGTFRGCDVSGMPLDPSHPWNREQQA